MGESTELEVGKIAASLGGKICRIKLCEIEVVDRYRQVFGDINALACSMEQKGQLQNIVVCEQDNPEFPFRLLAGGRRYKVMTEKLNWDECSALIFASEIDECEKLEVEWEENSRREDLDWKEDCALKRRIQELRLDKFGAKVGTSANSGGVSIRDTASLLNISPATMSRDVALAKAVEAVPALFDGCKNKKEAQKALRLASESMVRSELAKKTTQNLSADGKLRSLLDRYMTGDFFLGVKEVPDASIDFVEIDPPYAINLKEVKKLSDVRYSMNDYNEVAIADYLEFMAKTLMECWRVMTNHSFGVLWFAPDPWDAVLYDLLTKVGFETTRLTGKWIKPSGQTHQPQRYLANACEEFYYFWKGTPSIVRQGRTNIFQYSPVPPARKYHPTERPLELIMEVLSTFCFEGSRIMVPFLGSGKTILAAEQLGAKAFGWELSASFKDGYTVAANTMFSGKEPDATS